MIINLGQAEFSLKYQVFTSSHYQENEAPKLYTKQISPFFKQWPNSSFPGMLDCCCLSNGDEPAKLKCFNFVPSSKNHWTLKTPLSHNSPPTCPVASPTTRSAMKVSSVSPLRWETMTPQPALWDILQASIASVTVPIWLTFKSKALQAFFSMPIFTRLGLVTRRSSLVQRIQNTFVVTFCHLHNAFSSCFLRRQKNKI